MHRKNYLLDYLIPVFSAIAILVLLAVSDEAAAQIVPISQDRYVELYDDFGLEKQSAVDFGPFSASIRPLTGGEYIYGPIEQTSSIAEAQITAFGNADGAFGKSYSSVTFLISAPVIASYDFVDNYNSHDPPLLDGDLYNANDMTQRLISAPWVTTSNSSDQRSQTFALPAGVYTLNAFDSSEFPSNGVVFGNFTQSLVVSPLEDAGAHLPTALSSSGNSIPVGADKVGAIGGGEAAVGGGAVTLPQVTTAGVFTSLFFNVDSSAQFQAQLGEAPPAGVNFYLSPGQATQLWDLHYTGDFTGSATVTLHYDPTLTGGVDPSQLQIYHYTGGAWVPVANEIIDPVADTITFTTDSFSPFVLGVAVPEPGTFVLAAMATIGLIVVNRARVGRR